MGHVGWLGERYVFFQKKPNASSRGGDMGTRSQDKRCLQRDLMYISAGRSTWWFYHRLTPPLILIASSCMVLLLVPLSNLYSSFKSYSKHCLLWEISHVSIVFLSCWVQLDTSLLVSALWSSLHWTYLTIKEEPRNVGVMQVISPLIWPFQFLTWRFNVRSSGPWNFSTLT